MHLRSACFAWPRVEGKLHDQDGSSGNTPSIAQRSAAAAHLNRWAAGAPCNLSDGAVRTSWCASILISLGLVVGRDGSAHRSRSAHPATLRRRHARAGRVGQPSACLNPRSYCGRILWPTSRHAEAAQPVRQRDRLQGLLSLRALLALALCWAVVPPLARAQWAAAVEGGLDGVTLAKVFLAGGIGSCISHAVAVPFDVVKTRHQFDPGRYRHRDTQRGFGTFHTALHIAREEGPWMLFQGLGTTSLGYLFQGAVKFSLWEMFKASLGFSTAAPLARVNILIEAALAAEVFASMVLCPFERARIRLVSDPSFASGTLAAFSRLLRDEGVVKGLYGDGLAATLFKQSLYTVGKLATFVVLADALSATWPGLPRVMLTLLSSSIAGFVAAIVSQPGDTLQVCTSSNSALAAECPVDVSTGRPPSMWALARAIGLRGLFTGWQMRIMQIEVIVVTQLLIYDGIKAALGL